jgi:hypothetical protein
MLDVSVEPYAPMNSKAVKPLASDYRNEVTRQYAYSHEENDPVPHPKQWTIDKCQEWLDCHPIDDGGELYDLVTEIDKHRVVAEKAAAERLCDA